MTHPAIKQDLKQLKDLLARWQRAEEQMKNALGEPAVPNTARNVRLKDMQALATVIEFCEKT